MSTYELVIILLTLSNTMMNFIGLIIVLIKNTKKVIAPTLTKFCAITLKLT